VGLHTDKHMIVLSERIPTQMMEESRWHCCLTFT
jgi:hypothetical protein